jgi:hypothetical protein
VTAGDALREGCALSLAIGASPSAAAPASADALSAVPALFALLAAGGAAQQGASGMPADRQAGVAVSVCRRIAGASAPFEQRLEYAASGLALLAALPSGFTPRSLRCANRAGADAVTATGATVRLAAWWVAARALTVADAGALLSTAGAAYGDKSIASGAITAARVGAALMPSALQAGDAVTIPLSGLTGRWGTLLLGAYIERVTAPALSVDSPVGLSGAGWVPDLTFVS